MALIEEMNKSGNWLFRWRSFLPLVLYLMASAVILAEGDHHLPHFDLWWSCACLGISLFGQWIRAMTIGYTPRGTSGRNTREGQVAEVLNTKGIYSLVRHPLYLGNFFMWMGIVLFVGNWWFSAVVALLFWVYYERIMFAEEYFLRNKFGQAYLNWSSAVPAFWPRFSGYTRAGVTFSLRNVLKREYNGFFAVFVSFTGLDVLKNYVRNGYLDDTVLDPFWRWALALSLVLFIVLRILKKKTGLLNAAGREYTGSGA
jgi:protein-S-isoprenylcysteine O-methyltransferase Ste14